MTPPDMAYGFLVAALVASIWLAVDSISTAALPVAGALVGVR